MSNGKILTQDEKTFGMLAHLAALALFVLPSFGNVVGPLVIWLIKKDQSDWIDKQGKEALNFQISISIYAAAALVVMVMLLFTLVGIPFALLVAVLLIPLSVFWLIVVIIAAVKANEGEDYQYPLSIRFIK